MHGSPKSKRLCAPAVINGISSMVASKKISAPSNLVGIGKFRTFDCHPVCCFKYIKVQLVTLQYTHYNDTVELLMERTGIVTV